MIDAVGMEAHGSPVGEARRSTIAGLLPDAVAEQADGARPASTGSPRCTLPSTSSAAAARSRSSGVYGGMADPMPMMTLFDKQIQLRMGQANVRRWVDDILPLLTDDDPLGVDDFATHHLPLDEAPHAYEIFQRKDDGAVKIVFSPDHAHSRQREGRHRVDVALAGAGAMIQPPDFEALYGREHDPWQVGSSWYEQRKLAVVAATSSAALRRRLGPGLRHRSSRPTPRLDRRSGAGHRRLRAGDRDQSGHVQGAGERRAPSLSASKRATGSRALRSGGAELSSCTTSAYRAPGSVGHCSTAEPPARRGARRALAAPAARRVCEW